MIEVPFNSSGSSDGVARMPGALAAAGLNHMLAGDGQVLRTSFAPPVPVRGPTGLLAESALVTMIPNLAGHTARTIAEGGWPLVIGGDCAVLLGALAGMQGTHPQLGLLFVDGHEDAWPPRSSATGETADCDLGLALGWYKMPEPLAGTGPLVAAENVVVLGPRDSEELVGAGIESIRDLVQMMAGPDLARSDPSEIGSESARGLRGRSEGWWLHIDLDVLSTAVLPAVDYPQPGGIDWRQLTDLAGSAVREGGCLGASVVIYNPDLDQGANAARIVAFLGDLTASAAV
ncbi:MAG: arginase family protein [Acidimicrobiia bacterium]